MLKEDRLYFYEAEQYLRRNNMKRLIQFVIVSTFLLFAGITMANIQIVELINSKSSIQVGESFSVTAKYTTPSNNGAFGVGIRVHYDSNKLKFIGFKNSFAIGKVVQDNTPKDDTKQDYDHSTATDKYVVIAWGSTVNFWPNMPTPIDLSNLIFEAITSGETEILVSFSDVSEGYDSQAGSIAVLVE